MKQDLEIVTRATHFEVCGLLFFGRPCMRFTDIKLALCLDNFSLVNSLRLLTKHGIIKKTRKQESFRDHYYISDYGVLVYSELISNLEIFINLEIPDYEETILPLGWLPH